MRSCLLLIAVLCLTFALSVSTSIAQPPGGGQMRPGEQGRGAGGQRGGPGQGRSGDRHPLGGQFGQPSPPWLAIFDADSDGELSPVEIKNATAALLKLDRNRDGRLTVDEVVPNGGPAGGPPMGGPQGQFGGPRPGGQGAGGQGAGGPGGRGGDSGRSDAGFASQLMSLDTNKDGRLALSELPEHMHSMFDVSDTDKDGSLDQKELLVLASHFRREKLNPDGDIEMKNAPVQGGAPGRPR